MVIISLVKYLVLGIKEEDLIKDMLAPLSINNLRDPFLEFIQKNSAKIVLSLEKVIPETMQQDFPIPEALLRSHRDSIRFPDRNLKLGKLCHYLDYHYFDFLLFFENF